MLLTIVSTLVSRSYPRVRLRMEGNSGAAFAKRSLLLVLLHYQELLLVPEKAKSAGALATCCKFSEERVLQVSHTKYNATLSNVVITVL